MTWQPWLDSPLPTPRHYFAESAYWLAAGLTVQVDAWASALPDWPCLSRVLCRLALALDDLRMVISGYCWKEAHHA